MRGQPLPSKKHRRALQDPTYLGGMRNPAHTLDMAPGARASGQAVLDALSACITARPRILEPCSRRFANEETEGFDWLAGGEASGANRESEVRKTSSFQRF